MFKIALGIAITLAPSTTLFAMLRRPPLRAPVAQRTTRGNCAGITTRASKPIYYELNRFVSDSCFKDPNPDISYTQVGKQIYCQLLALKIMHYQHLQKHGRAIGHIGKIAYPQDEAQDMLQRAINEFEKVFINPDECTNRLSEIYPPDYPLTPEHELIATVMAAECHLEKNLSRQQLEHNLSKLTNKI